MNYPSANPSLTTARARRMLICIKKVLGMIIIPKIQPEIRCNVLMERVIDLKPVRT